MKPKRLKIWLSCFCLVLISSDLKSQDYSVFPTNFNSDGSDFAPVLFGSGVIFCSNRNQKIHKMDEDSLQMYRTDLFYIQLENNQSISEPYLFSEEITTWLNEGPCVFDSSKTTMVYTGNIPPPKLNKGDKVKEYKLGLFFAYNVDGTWSNIKPFEFNTKENKYNIAHPALSPDGKRLVFSSNMTGTLGMADLFECYLIDGQWTQPKNLGPAINTKKNEFYPYFNSEGKLYFSSNGHHAEEDLDVYYTVINEGTWRKPISLPGPINSPSDDFGMVSSHDGRFGFLTSNRLTGGMDDIFSFQCEFPSFVNCNKNYKPKMCYVFEELNEFDNDTLPLVLEWDLGDGTKAIGSRVEHCYADSGLYKISINLLDSVSGQYYTNISSTEIHILKPAQPFISCQTQLQTEVNEEFVVTGNSMKDFDLEEYYWEFGDKQKSKGLFAYNTYATPGHYQVKVGAISYPDVSGKRQTICTYKDVEVLENGSVTIADENEPMYVSINSDKFKRHLPTLNPRDSAAYFVVVKETGVRMPLNDPFFDRIGYEIREKLDSLLNLYRYTVGEGSSLLGVYGIYSELLKKGYTDILVKGETFKKFSETTTHKGSFIAVNDTLAVNREFSKFSHINFEYNSYEIMDDSYTNLDYIISMLKVTPKYKISISAHTDIIGGDEFNQKLSDKRAKSVVDYFNKNGIDKKRSKWQGFGSTMPIADNETDDGRAQNRRVEFELIGTPLTLTE